jgi:fatty acid desaturase
MPPSVISPSEIRALSGQTNWAALGRLVVSFLLISALAVAAGTIHDAYGLLAVMPLMLGLGFFIAFLFIIVHETAHKTAFKTRALNVIIGQLCGSVIALPYQYYCLFHWDHHRFKQDPVRDPELVVAPRTDTLVRRALAFTGLPQLLGRVALIFRHALVGKVEARWVPEDKRTAVVREARIHLALYLLVAALSIVLGTAILLWIWLVPLVVGQLFLRPYLYTEHTGCGRSRSAFENTRTTCTTGLVRWITWNMPFHAEHHAYPSVPFHALPRLHALVRDRIVHTGRGYREVIPAVWAWHRLQGVPSTESTSSRA